MSPLQHRSPGMVGAIFCAEQAMASIIPDGYHVDWPAIQIAKKQLGDRLFVITDAVTDTTAGPYRHQLGNDCYEAGGILSGSSLTMLKALNNLIRFCHIDLEEALRMCSLYPAKALGLDKRLGKLAPGYDAHWTALSRQDSFYTLANL
jgi:N-acetylglucosamine-6-phosphate deacetylase